MSKHPYLLSAEKMLKKQGYYTVFASDSDGNALRVSESKQDNSFLYLVVDEEVFPGIAMCLSTSYYNIFNIASITVGLMHISSVCMGDPFYVSADGNTYWNEDAFTQLEIESVEFLEKLTPESKAIH